MTTFEWPPTGWAVGTPYTDTTDPNDTDPMTQVTADAMNAVIEQVDSVFPGDLLTMFSFHSLPDGLIIDHDTNGHGSLDPIPAGDGSVLPCLVDRSSYGADAQEAWTTDGVLKIRAADWVSSGTGDLAGVIVGVGVGQLTAHRITLRLRGVERGPAGTSQFTNSSYTAEAHTEFSTADGGALALNIHYHKTASVEHTDIIVTSNVPTDAELWSMTISCNHVRGTWVLDHRGGGDYRILRNGVQIGQVTDSSMDPADFASVIYAVRSPYFDDAPIAVLLEGGAITPSRVPAPSFGIRSQAADLAFDPTGTSLTAKDIQAAIEALEARIVALEP